MQPLPSFAELIAELGDMSSILTAADTYWGHSARQAGESPELLATHMRRVMDYFRALSAAHGLDAVADQLAYELAPADAPDQALIATWAKRLLVATVWYHDFGKVNAGYQQHIGNAPAVGWPEVRHEFNSDHAALGAYLFVVREFTRLPADLTPQARWRLLPLIAALSYPIERHHSPRLFDDVSDHTPFAAPRFQALHHYLPLYGTQPAPQLLTRLAEIAAKGFKGLVDLEKQHSAPNGPVGESPFALYAFVRLAFSLLTASDYYATAHHYNGWADAHPYNDFGLIKGELRTRFIQKAREHRDYNRVVTTRLEYWLDRHPEDWQAISNENLNNLRARMAAEVVSGVRANAGDRLFYLHAPTGGGKTNLALLATAELLAANPELNKVFYVFPFTTLITQTWQAIQETLDLSADEVVQLHARADYARKQRTDAPEADARYGADHLDELDNQFVNFPVCLLTHVRFVGALKTHEKQANYLLHRLANSVVVLDELQSYDPKHWDKLAWLLAEYARTFNIRFVLMSATLPRLDELAHLRENGIRITDLLPDARKRFFQNPNFQQRVRFDLSLLETLAQPERGDQEARQQFLLTLAARIRSEADQWGQTANRDQVRVVVEFIFKQAATEFALIAKEQLPEYTVVVMSGTILEPRRREVIRFLKEPPEACRRVLLITTQVVEAGVDIDMDLGFKDRSLLDSEEQLAGRINRNARKPQGTLWLFQLDSALVLYGHDKRYKVQEALAREEVEQILTTKDFDRLYNPVMAGIDNWNQKAGAINLKEYQAHFRRLNFPQADQSLQLIEQDTTPWFVPCRVPVFPRRFAAEAWQFDPEAVCLLTDAQCAFLAEQGIQINNGELDGQEVFDLLEQLIKPAHKTARQQQRQQLKRLQGILGLFTFSLFAHSRVTKELQSSFFAQERCGYWYLDPNHMATVYHLETGLDPGGLAGANFL